MAERPLVYESENFWVDFEDEDVVLRGRQLPDPLVIGNFYVSASEAAFDPDERWCVMVGSGLIVQHLGPPWTPYHSTPVSSANRHHRYSKRGNWGLPTVHATDQWWEYGLGPDDRVWLETVDYVKGERFEPEATARETGDEPIRYAILAQSQVVRAIEWPPDRC